MVSLNRKGISLVIAMTIIAIVVFILLSAMPQALNEFQTAKRLINTTAAFYAADSGINKGIWSLNNYVVTSDWTGGGWVVDEVNGVNTLSTQALTDLSNKITAYYQVNITGVGTDTPTVNSTGYAPTAGDAARSLKAQLKRMPVVVNPAAITAIIESKGSATVGGSSTIVGDVVENSAFSFEDIFGLTMDEIKGYSGGAIVNPANNYSPVSGTTYFEVAPGEKFTISSSSWTGSGIMIIDGDVKITGGTFNGVIWVTGTVELEIAGNPDIYGALLVEGDVSIKGNAYLEYSEDEITNAFNNDYPPLPFAIDQWDEI